MSVINICPFCGGYFEYNDGKWKCRFCGSYQPDEISSEEAALVYNASQKLRLADFYEAELEFDDIVHQYPGNSYGYWGRLMAKYGIKYEEDYDGGRIPTCYAASIESVYASEDYKMALKYANEGNREFYRTQAEYIERVRKEWIQKAKKEKPYDVFICYKESDSSAGMERTPDSNEMQDLYIRLTQKGYRVFFSRESLSDKVGEKYEPYIFNALSTAKVMLVYGSKPEYINSTWMKNEWTRYGKLIQSGIKHEDSLLVACRNFSPNELPAVLRSRQCFDAKKLTFYGELIETIEKIIVRKHVPDQSKDGGKEDSLCKHIAVDKPAVAPTCTDFGWTASTQCELCGAILKVPELIPATGHHFGEWHVKKKSNCTEEGEYERVCKCGARETKKIPAGKGHTPGRWQIEKNATPTEDGRRVKRCVVCGLIVAEESIPSEKAKKKTSFLWRSLFCIIFGALIIACSFFVGNDVLAKWLLRLGLLAFLVFATGAVIVANKKMGYVFYAAFMMVVGLLEWQFFFEILAIVIAVLAFIPAIRYNKYPAVFFGSTLAGLLAALLGFTRVALIPAFVLSVSSACLVLILLYVYSNRFERIFREKATVLGVAWFSLFGNLILATILASEIFSRMIAHILIIVLVAGLMVFSVVYTCVSRKANVYSQFLAISLLSAFGEAILFTAFPFTASYLVVPSVIFFIADGIICIAGIRGCFDGFSSGGGHTFYEIIPAICHVICAAVSFLISRT